VSGEWLGLTYSPLTTHLLTSLRGKETALRTRSLYPLCLVVVTVSASGAHCHRNPFVTVPQAPQILQPQAQLADVATAVNHNTQLVRSLKTSQATVALSAGPMPISLNADIALERPKRFRLKASQALLGPVADLGSNDQLFWFWAKTLQPPALYFCTHEQFPVSPARQIMPLEPAWLVEAFGLTTFDPAEPHQGPFPDQQGRLKIHSLRQTPSGPVTKVTILDARTALVLEQQLFDQQGRLLISAITSQHQKDAASGAWLPRKIDLSSNASGQRMALSVQIGQLEVNTLTPADAVIFQKPSYQEQGAPDIDLGNPNLRFTGPAQFGPAPVPPPAQSRPTYPARRLGQR
jgi:hypothetical protein